MDKNYAVIFKRAGFEEGKGCKLEPIGYVEGTEAVVNGVKCFMIDPNFRKHLLEDVVPNLDMESFLKANKKAKYMGDRSNFSIKYVYGSPLSSQVFKDLIVYNFSYLEVPFQIFGKTTLEESYNESVEKFKEQYIEALKQYNFYQLVSSEGKVNTIIQRKEPQFKGVAMNGVIPEIITEEIGFEIPKDYDFSGDYSSVYKQIPTEIDTRTMFEEVKKYIKGQDEHIVPLINAINDNLAAEIPEERTQIVVCGPTGSGKTATIERIAKLSGLPYVVVDTTQYSKAGYEGRNVTDVFEEIKMAANGDEELAQRAIVLFDESDKKASAKGANDVSGREVLISMLKMLEGKEYSYEVGNGFSKEIKVFNTLNLTIVFAGAFEGLAELAKPEKKLGFSRTEEVKSVEDAMFDGTTLEKYGIPKEFAGRLYFELFEKLSVESLKDILLNSKVNPIDLFIKKADKRYNTEVVIAPGFVDTLAQAAYDDGYGARSLYKMFRILAKRAETEISLMSKKVRKQLLLTPECVYDNRMYQLNAEVKVKTLRR